MPYMPERIDRDILGEDQRRIWDYFFRINSNDVGKSRQQEEIKDKKNSLNIHISEHNKKVKDINYVIEGLEQSIYSQRLRVRLFGFSFLAIGFLSFMYFLFATYFEYLFPISVPILVVGMIFLVTVRFIARAERENVTNLNYQLALIKEEISSFVSQTVKKILLLSRSAKVPL